MADAKKCDVCGAFYEKYNFELHEDHAAINTLIFAYNGGVIRSYDICPACMGVLVNWITNGGEKDGQIIQCSINSGADEAVGVED